MRLMARPASTGSILLALCCAGGCATNAPAPKPTGSAATATLTATTAAKPTSSATAPTTTATAPITTTAPTSPSSLTAQFAGNWTGHLEYRDFQSNAQVFLPTWLTIRERPDRTSLELDYLYDDGPNKTVRERMILAIDRAAATIRMTSDRDHTSEIYIVEGLDGFAKQGRGTLTLTGPGTENDKQVQVRITLTLRRNLYTLRKETQHVGEGFKLRHGYTFTRAQPPA